MRGHEGWTWIDLPGDLTLSGQKTIEAWCDNTTQGEFDINLWYILFELDSDATMFTLRWC